MGPLSSQEGWGHELGMHLLAEQQTALAHILSLCPHPCPPLRPQDAVGSSSQWHLDHVDVTAAGGAKTTFAHRSYLNQSAPTAELTCAGMHDFSATVVVKGGAPEAEAGADLWLALSGGYCSMAEVKLTEQATVNANGENGVGQHSNSKGWTNGDAHDAPSPLPRVPLIRSWAPAP